MSPSHDLRPGEAAPEGVGSTPGIFPRRGFVTTGTGYPRHMIILGVVCLILGLVLGAPILWTIGIVLVVVGLALLLLGSTGRAFGGRRHYW